MTAADPTTTDLVVYALRKAVDGLSLYALISTTGEPRAAVGRALSALAEAGRVERRAAHRDDGGTTWHMIKE